MFLQDYFGDYILKTRKESKASIGHSGKLGFISLSALSEVS